MSYRYDPAIAVAALEHVRSVSYPVGLRWVFYRLLQAGVLADKGDYARLTDILTQARKGFLDGWQPDTLVDEGRTIAESASAVSAEEMLARLPYYVDLKPDLYADQQAVPFLIYEAATSDGQFHHFAPWADRAALRGDASIPHKWAVAKRCDALASLYGLPVHVLYFGDHDTKGKQIPESAMADVRAWVAPGTELRFTRIGLNADHAERFGIPEKPEKPGTYEWESLSHADAGTLIAEGLASVVDVPRIHGRQQAAEAETEALRARVAVALEAV